MGHELSDDVKWGLSCTNAWKEEDGKRRVGQRLMLE